MWSGTAVFRACAIFFFAALLAVNVDFAVPAAALIFPARGFVLNVGAATDWLAALAGPEAAATTPDPSGVASPEPVSVDVPGFDSGVATFATPWTGVVAGGTTGCVTCVAVGVVEGCVTGGGLTGGVVCGGFRGRTGTVLVGTVAVTVGVGGVDAVEVVSVDVVSVGVVSVGVVSVGVVSVGVLTVGVVSVGVVAAPPPSAKTDAVSTPSTRRTARPTCIRTRRYLTGRSLAPPADQDKRPLATGWTERRRWLGWIRTGQDGPTITLSDADVGDTDRRRRQEESVVPIAAGEQLTERQALQALLLPSANNIAVVLARWDGGSADRFVARMNATARSLGMTRTRYTDPSGDDAATVSTAADQVRIVDRAMRLPAFASIVATPSATLPVAGTVHNTDALLGHDGFVGVKTGSDDAAGGCFAFRAIRWIDGKRTAITGVVLGQPGDNQIAAGLAAADAMVDRIANQS